VSPVKICDVASEIFEKHGVSPVKNEGVASENHGVSGPGKILDVVIENLKNYWYWGHPKVLLGTSQSFTGDNRDRDPHFQIFDLATSQISITKFLWRRSEILLYSS
jgi:hypothetical protein